MPGIIKVTEQEQVIEHPVANSLPNDVMYFQHAQAMLQLPPLNDMDLEKMHTKLYCGHYQ